ncbi:MAG TPA: hypothetical protein VFX76_11900 [Roseiflexaceae bacterium]|nr:hypothetical protein [Roseiflexaceae bacterium]
MTIHRTHIARSTIALALSACTIIAFTGCEQQPTTPTGGQPSQPAPRTPNKPVAPDAGPTEGAMQSNATSPPERPAQSSGSPTAIAPTGGSEMVLPRPAPSAAGDDPAVATFAGLSAPKPATWQYRAPAGTSGMRVAEYGVPGVEGSDQANIIVYQFPGGGSFQSNVDRWKTQFRGEGDAPVEAKVEEFEADGMKVGVAELNGAYRGMNSAEFATDHTLIAAMIETDGNPVFVQFVGPSKTVQSNREAFLAMIKGIKRSEPLK